VGNIRIIKPLKNDSMVTFCYLFYMGKYKENLFSNKENKVRQLDNDGLINFWSDPWFTDSLGTMMSIDRSVHSIDRSIHSN